MSSNNTKNAQDITVFEVDSAGTLSVAEFVNATQRKDFYPQIADWWDDSTENLKQAINECPPFRWALEKLYWDYNDEDAADPAEDLQTLTAWLDTFAADSLHERIMPALRLWFEQPPKWSFEDDYLDTSNSTGQGAAMSYFKGMDAGDLDLLGVEIVEGDSPGSTYMAAELNGDIEVANALAVENGIPVRFKKC